MKMTLKEVTENRDALAALGGLVLPAKLSFAVKRNLDNLQKEAKRVEEQRIELCRRYTDKDENGEPVMVERVVGGQAIREYKMSDGNQKEFGREYADLLKEEVDVDIRTVKAELVEQCEASERYSIPTVGQLSGMAFMIEE